MRLEKKQLQGCACAFSKEDICFNAFCNVVCLYLRAPSDEKNLTYTMAYLAKANKTNRQTAKLFR